MVFSFAWFSMNNRGRLTYSLEEHLDHIHYLQDIFLLNVDGLNNVLKDQLMNRLLIPVYIFSLIKNDKDSKVTISLCTSFYMHFFFNAGFPNNT